MYLILKHEKYKTMSVVLNSIFNILFPWEIEFDNKNKNKNDKHSQGPGESGVTRNMGTLGVWQENSPWDFTQTCILGAI